ncbi:hypothetical protein [Microvirga sp. VF16]|uniref:DUF6894 family protein n=1 Tax=Microvirga sp. VF16 TaxID=2807101 RepID=UPI0035304246
MERYYFNLSDGRRWYRDCTGVALDCPAAARQHALQDARALLQSWMAWSGLHWRLVVHDSGGTVVCSLSLAEAAVLEIQAPCQGKIEPTGAAERPRRRTSQIFQSGRKQSAVRRQDQTECGPLCTVSGVTGLRHEPHNDG